MECFGVCAHPTARIVTLSRGVSHPRGQLGVSERGEGMAEGCGQADSYHRSSVPVGIQTMPETPK